MRILVGCEFSNTVSQAFRDRGHEVYSCDLDPSEGLKEWHLQDDIMSVLRYQTEPFDLIILHPDCHHMACSGNRWWAGTEERNQAISWAVRLYRRAKECVKPVYGGVAMENPQWSVLWKHLGGRTQTIHPWEYGHRETKATGLKLHNLPPLKPTDVVGPPPPSGTEERKEWERVWRMGPSKHYDRSKERARFLQGWADAMAEQWGR